jgi:hypothetical protein
MFKTMLPAIIGGAFAFGALSLTVSGQPRANEAPRGGAAVARPMTIAMTADRWQTKENAEFIRQLGFFHGLMRLNSGNAVLKDVTFSDGTIELDVNTIGRGAPGIAFRQQDEGSGSGVSHRCRRYPTERRLRTATCRTHRRNGRRSARSAAG